MRHFLRNSGELLEGRRNRPRRTLEIASIVSAARVQGLIAVRWLWYGGICIEYGGCEPTRARSCANHRTQPRWYKQANDVNYSNASSRFPPIGTVSLSIFANLSFTIAAVDASCENIIVVRRRVNRRGHWLPFLQVYATTTRHWYADCE